MRQRYRKPYKRSQAEVHKKTDRKTDRKRGIDEGWNLSQTVWRRDIKKKIQARRKEILFPLSAEENVSMLKEVSPKEAPIFAWAQAAVGGEHTKTGVYAILRAAGDLAAKGAEPVAVSARLQVR